MPLLRIDFSGIEKLMETFRVKLYNVPLAKRREMVEVAAENVLKDLKKNARAMAHGKYSLPESDAHTIANAAYIDNKGMSDEVNPYAIINFKGTTNQYNEPREKHPVRYRKAGGGYKWSISTKQGKIKNGKRRIAEIAFLNEYGVPKNANQKARGFMAKAMDSGMTASVDAILDILEEFMVDELTKAL